MQLVRFRVRLSTYLEAAHFYYKMLVHIFGQGHSHLEELIGAKPHSWGKALQMHQVGHCFLGRARVTPGHDWCFDNKIALLEALSRGEEEMAFCKQT